MSQLTLADGTITSVNPATQFKTRIGETDVVPMTCSSILSFARTAGSRANFLRKYMLQGTQNTNLKVNLEILAAPLGSPYLVPTQDVSVAPGYSVINNYLTKVQDTQLPVLQLVSACLSEAAAPNMKELKVAEADYEEAKGRYEGITTDVERVSYYEGWFPMFRPMKESSIFILFGISVFILVISILMLLQVSGVNVNISFPVEFFISMYFLLGNTLQYFWGYMVGGLVVGIVCIIFAFMKGWI